VNPNRFNSSPFVSTLSLGVVAFALLCVGTAQADPLEAAARPAPAAAHKHANAEHPAVQVARLAAERGIDANTFLVQPPASVSWTLGPADEPALRVASLKAAPAHRVAASQKPE